jgi:S-layer homology domain
MNSALCRSMGVIAAIILTLGSFFSVSASPASTVNIPTPRIMYANSNGNAATSRATNYYLADRVINNTDFAKLASWGINTAIVDFDVNGSASAWRAVFTSAAAANIDVVIWPSDWNDPRPHCGWEAPYPASATGDITKVKKLLDVASQYPNFIGVVNAHESFWTCDMSFDEMAGLKDQLKAYALSRGRSIKVWNYIDNLYDKSMLPDNQIERIMDVAVTWQHCAGNVEGTCNTTSSSSALNMILSDRNRIANSGAQVELVFLMQTFTTGGYSTMFTLSQLQNYSCQFLNTSALDGFGFYTWHAGWWSDLHSWPALQPAVQYIHDSCTNSTAFRDVPVNYWARGWIERLNNAGITDGCGAGNYCPENTVTRAQMAIFLERGMHGSSFIPPTTPITFGDTGGHWAQYWIEALKADGITSGCGAGNYCPESFTTRADMAVFLLRSTYGVAYTPPAVGASTGFRDVFPNYWAAAWIKQLVAEGITTGCGNVNYCPEALVTRAQMAVFLVRTFNLP